MFGNVVYYNFVKQFGFIQHRDSEEQFFFNRSCIRLNAEAIQVGSFVEFDPSAAPRDGSKRVAINVAVGQKEQVDSSKVKAGQ